MYKACLSSVSSLSGNLPSFSPEAVLARKLGQTYVTITAAATATATPQVPAMAMAIQGDDVLSCLALNSTVLHMLPAPWPGTTQPAVLAAGSVAKQPVTVLFSAVSQQKVHPALKHSDSLTIVEHALVGADDIAEGATVGVVEGDM